jgi:uncharacterized protein
MDREYFMHGQGFIWNIDKAGSNLADHGVSFEEACEVFFDPFCIFEDASTENERRDAAIGFAMDMQSLYVVYTERGGELIRVISARVADRSERALYEKSQ